MIKSYQHYSSPALSATETLDETSVAGYMNADFITVPATMTVNHAREYLLSQLKTDEIPTGYLLPRTIIICAARCR